MVNHWKTYPFIVAVMILTFSSCAPRQVTSEVPFKYYDHANVSDPFSIELISGEIIPVRFHDLIMAELTDSLYIVYYREGDKVIFPVQDIKAIRFDVIDSGSKRRQNLKFIGAVVGAVYVALAIAFTIALIVLIAAIFAAF